jgi:hypothetical protein
MTQLPASQASASLASWQWSLPHGLINDVRVVSCCMSDVRSRWHEWRVQTPTPKPAVPPEASRLAREWPAHDFAQKCWGKPIHHKQPQLWDYQMELSATPCHSHSLKYLEESNVTTCHNCSSLLAAPVRLKGPMRHRHLVVVDPLLRCQWDLRCEVPHSQQET